jgi:hypothetical protein
MSIMNAIISTFRALQDVEVMLEITSSIEGEEKTMKQLTRERDRLAKTLSNLISIK